MLVFSVKIEEKMYFRIIYFNSYDLKKSLNMNKLVCRGSQTLGKLSILKDSIYCAFTSFFYTNTTKTIHVATSFS